MFIPRLEQVKIVLLHLTNGIRKERAWFATIGVAWCVLVLEVTTSRTQECSSSEYFPYKCRQSSETFVTFHLWEEFMMENNLSLTRAGGCFWNIGTYAASVLHFQTDMTLVKAENSRKCQVVTGAVPLSPNLQQWVVRRS